MFQILMLILSLVFSNVCSDSSTVSSQHAAITADNVAPVVTCSDDTPCKGNANVCKGGRCVCGDTGAACPRGGANSCKGTAGTALCAGCNADDDCGGTVPYCAPSAECVGCRKNGDCTDPNKSKCDLVTKTSHRNTCVQCTEQDGGCVSGQACDISTGTCVPEFSKMASYNPILKQNYVLTTNTATSPANLIGNQLCSPSVSASQCPQMCGSGNCNVSCLSNLALCYPAANTCRMHYGLTTADDALICRYKGLAGTPLNQSCGVTFTNNKSHHTEYAADNDVFASFAYNGNDMNKGAYPVSAWWGVGANYLILRDNCAFEPVKSDGTVNLSFTRSLSDPLCLDPLPKILCNQSGCSCVQCETDSDCTSVSGKPKCDLPTGTCVSCLKNSDCTRTGTGIAYCDSAGCTACSSDKPRYNAANNTCAACPPTTPRYNSATNTCVVCNQNSDCDGAGATTGICTNGGNSQASCSCGSTGASNCIPPMRCRSNNTCS